MIKLTLKRIAETPDSTAGALWHGEKFICFTIEDGHRDVKVKGETRIPAGTYMLKKSTDTRFNTDYQKRFGMNWVMRLLNVPNFEGIEIHLGNYPSSTNGCILPNWSIGYAPQINEFFGENSLRALRTFYDHLDQIKETDIWLEVIDPL